MFHDANPIERSAAAIAGFRSLRSWMKRLGGHRGETAAASAERFPAESDLHALDDVACVRSRRR